MIKVIKLEDIEYELIKNYKDGYDEELLKNKYTDYFEPYDYIFGDFSYDQLRLKGFYEHNNPSVNKNNDIEILDNYIINYCAYDCRYFLLKKKNEKVNKNSWN